MVALESGAKRQFWEIDEQSELVCKWSKILEGDDVGVGKGTLPPSQVGKKKSSLERPDGLGEHVGGEG